MSHLNKLDLSLKLSREEEAEQLKAAQLRMLQQEAAAGRGRHGS